MSDTYIGWDGKSYPWPPPDGWYHASDGRWWAPGSGPNPPPEVAGFDGGATVLAGRTAELDHTSQYPQAARYPEPVRGAAASTPSYFDADPRYDDPRHADPHGADPRYDDHYHDLAGPGGRPYNDTAPPPPTAGPLPGPGPDLDDDPYGYGAPPVALAAEGEGLGPKKLVIAVAAVLAVVAIGISAFVVLGRDDDTALDANGTTTTVAGAGAGTTVATLPVDPAATSVPGATVAPDPGAVTTVAPDPAAASGGTLSPENAALVGSFRALLVQNGLTSDKLTDTEIQSFAASFCVFAKNSKSNEDFNVFREQAISETQSSLDPASLNKVIDAAVITFCPDEATRLGITLG